MDEYPVEAANFAAIWWLVGAGLLGLDVHLPSGVSPEVGFVGGSDIAEDRSTMTRKRRTRDTALFKTHLGLGYGFSGRRRSQDICMFLEAHEAIKPFLRFGSKLF